MSSALGCSVHWCPVNSVQQGSPKCGVSLITHSVNVDVHLLWTFLHFLLEFDLFRVFINIVLVKHNNNKNTKKRSEDTADMR